GGRALGAVTDDGDEADRAAIAIAIERHRLLERSRDAVDDRAVFEGPDRCSGPPDPRVHLAKLPDPRRRSGVVLEARADQLAARTVEQSAERVVDVAVVAGAIDDGAGVLDLIEDRFGAHSVQLECLGELMVQIDLARDRDDAAG